MNNAIASEGRFHSLDALRAIMMLLGVVLHSAESYNIGHSVIWPRDPHSAHIFLNYLNSTIHVFRMPVFFLVAGFFGALLYHKRGPADMIRNRVIRIVLPFVAFLFTLHPIIVLVFRYTLAIFDSELSGVSTALTVLPDQTYHLWFLYYLAIITFFVFSFTWLFRRTRLLGARLDSIFIYIMERQVLAISIFGFLLFLIMLYRWDYGVPTPLRFVPNIGALMFFLLFYIVGWLLYKSRQVLNILGNTGLAYTLIATVGYACLFWFGDNINEILVGVVHAMVSWFFVFGITGSFVRFSNFHTPTMRYISDASYWIYLSHLPITILLPGLISNWTSIALIKFLTTLLLTSLFCFVTYHYLVRSSFLGQFLNGRKYLKGEIAGN